MTKQKGLFVTFEGPNGVGKSSLLRSVAIQLHQSNFAVLVTKEPTLSPLGDFIRQAEEQYDGRILACLVAADRYYHLNREVLPALKEGKIVLSDRYVESSLVLQRLDGVELDFIWSLNGQIYIPSLSVILTASAEILEKRMRQRGNQLSRFERTKDRATELAYYLEAADFLSRQGFDVFSLENGITPLKENIRNITQQILSLITN